jgi:hypothetical protein
MATIREQGAGLLDRYLDEVNGNPVSLDEVADWALREGLYRPAPQDIRKLCREAIADGARSQKRFDGKRWYRAKHAVSSNVGGVQMTLWADIDKNASPAFMAKSIAIRRRSVVNDCYQMKMDVDHFNEMNPAAGIQLILDFTEDVAEREASGRFEDDDKAA